MIFICFIFCIITLFASYGVIGHSIQINDPEQSRYETVFVVEFIRHGARSHYEDNVPKEFFKVKKPGYVTTRGKVDHYRIGHDRRREYID